MLPTHRTSFRAMRPLGRLRSVAAGIRLVLAALACTIVAVIGIAGPAAAHNTLVRAEPADGATLDVAPERVVFVFAKDVPLDTATLELIDAGGARRALTPASGATAKEVTAPFPAGIAGEVTVRWRLVGPDGHVLSARVRFTVPSTAPPERTAPVTPTIEVPDVAAPAPEVSEAAGPIRFGVRFAGFVAAAVLGGILATALVVAPVVSDDRRVRLAIVASTAALAVTAVAGLWILASDIGGSWPAASGEDLRSAVGLEAGQASVARVVLAGIVATVLFALGDRIDVRTRLAGAAGVTGLLLATWSYAGHARGARWAWLGIPLDVIHHASAAAWLGGLLLMVGVVLPAAEPDEAAVAVRRFSSLASVTVTALVATGVVQGVRLVGGPTRLFTTGHGQLLVAKLVVLAGMLWVANLNRRRVQRRFSEPSPPSPWLRQALRRAMVTESVLGLAILAVTAVLVVTTPATGTTGAEVASTRTSTGRPSP